MKVLNFKSSLVFSNMAVATVFLAMGLSFATRTEAQEVAAAPVVVEKSLYDGTAEISSLITNGNTKNQTTGVAFDITYRPDPWLVNLKSKYQTTVSQEVQTQELFEIAGRGGRKLTDVTDVFVEHTYLKNRFAGTDNRYITSAGLGRFWVQSDAQTLRTEAALGYTHEDRTDATQLSFMSGVVGLLYKYKITATSDISHETKYQPNFKTSDDWRLTTETALSAAISSMLSSKVSWKYEHVNMPTAGKVKGDTTTMVSLLAKF